SKSTAALRIYNNLPWYWKWTQLCWIFPKFFRNWVYGIIAKNRYKWFGKRETCMAPTPELKDRFLY
ncbi:MAG TPA: DCC1-like thiol-disulfide oxidoreductase family protein, partial [Chitinophagaceae bacterium]|nr:DCC1-like thiol-disulfide oxidoreductase family protein [Chitinophagaceae bacterium]